MTVPVWVLKWEAFVVTDNKSAASFDASRGSFPGAAWKVFRCVARGLQSSRLGAVALALSGVMLAAAPYASATDAPPSRDSAPIDVWDIYSGAVVLNMEKCCDCHKVECR